MAQLIVVTGAELREQSRHVAKLLTTSMVAVKHEGLQKYFPGYVARMHDYIEKQVAAILARNPSADMARFERSHEGRTTREVNEMADAKVLRHLEKNGVELLKNWLAMRQTQCEQLEPTRQEPTQQELARLAQPRLAKGVAKRKITAMAADDADVFVAKRKTSHARLAQFAIHDASAAVHAADDL